MKPTVGFIFAHPDDESFSISALSQVLGPEGVKMLLLMATCGEAGRAGLPPELKDITPSDLAERRRGELAAVAKLLGIAEVVHLDYHDGQVAEVPSEELQAKVESFLNKYQIKIVISFPADGITGHKDHIAVSTAVRAAVRSGRCPTVERLYTVRLGTDVLAANSTYAVDSTPYWSLKKETLLAHYSQKFTVLKHFGDLTTPPDHMKHEMFELEWSKDGQPISKLESALSFLAEK